MKLCLAIAAAVLLLAPAGCRRQPRGASATRPTRPAPSDKLEAEAWAVAHKLGEAWQKKDVAAARKLMTPGLLDRISEQAIRDFVAGPASHVHKGAEVVGGRRRSDGRMEVTLRLTVEYRAQMDPHADVLDRVVVLKREFGEWLVDGLPGPGGGG